LLHSTTSRAGDRCEQHPEDTPSRRSRPFAASWEQAPGKALYKCQPKPLASRRQHDQRL